MLTAPQSLSTAPSRPHTDCPAAAAAAGFVVARTDAHPARLLGDPVLQVRHSCLPAVPARAAVDRGSAALGSTTLSASALHYM